MHMEHLQMQVFTCEYVHIYSECDIHGTTQKRELDKVTYYLVADFRDWIYDSGTHIRRFPKLSAGTMAREIVGNALNNRRYKLKSSAVLYRNNAASFLGEFKKTTVFDWKLFVAKIDTKSWD